MHSINELSFRLLQQNPTFTGTITTPGSATTTITGLTTAGTYVFQWSIANAPCTASTDQISVNVNPAPTVSNAGPDASVCGLVATLAGNTPTAGRDLFRQSQTDLCICEELRSSRHRNSAR